MAIAAEKRRHEAGYRFGTRNPAREPQRVPLAKQTKPVPERPRRDEMDIKTEFMRLIDEAAPHFSAQRKAELVAYFVAATDPRKPMPWAMKPQSWSVVQYIRSEYRDKGLIEAGITAADVGKYDPDFAKIYRAHYARERLPQDCHFAKGSKWEPADRRVARGRLLGISL